MQSLQQWGMSGNIHYRCGVDVAKDREAALQEILNGLSLSVAVSHDERAEFMVLQSDRKR